MNKEQSSIVSARLLASADRDVWPSEALITGVLDVTNTADTEPLVFSTGNPAVGTLSTLEGTAVGNDNRPHRGVGHRVDLAPGETTTVHFICFSSNIDAERRTTLPPGGYLLTVHLRVTSDQAADHLTAPPVPIRLE